jgi:3-hydroxybutyryl-CoA dehydrogenase
VEPLSERVAVIGAGTIAVGILRTVARVSSACALVRSPASAQRLRARMADCPHPVVVSEDPEVLADRSFVIEAVAEDLSTKREVLATAGARAPAGTLLASTTSSLALSDLGDASSPHGAVIGFHPFTPVQRMEVIEVAFPDGSDDSARRRTLAVCDAIGKQAIEVPAMPGYVVNRVLFPYLFAAVELAGAGGPPPEAIDRCITGAIAHPLGPFAVLDLIGLDVAVAIGHSLELPVPRRLSELVAAGHLGRKTGRGFHTYDASPRPA